MTRGEDFQHRMEKLQQAFSIPSVSAALYLRGEVYTYHGGCTPDTLFAIASCTKSLLAGTVLRLQEKQLLSLDDRVCDRAADLALSDPQLQREVTIRDILSHRSGLAGCDLAWYSRHDTFTQADLKHALSLLPVPAKRGERFQYSNLAYALCGEIVEHAAGQSWQQTLRETILEPLGMHSAAFSPAEAAETGPVALPYVQEGHGCAPIPCAAIGAVAPAGCLYCTAEDLLKWNIALLHRGCFEETTVLSAASVREMTTPHIAEEIDIAVPALTRAVQNRSYGLGLELEEFHGRSVIYHGGDIDGFRAEQVILPEEDCAAVFLSNLGGTMAREAFRASVCGARTGDETDWIQEFYQMQERLHSESAASATARAGALQQSPDDWQLCGAYENPLFGRLSFTIEHRRLCARIGDLPFTIRHGKDGQSLYHPEMGELPFLVRRDDRGDGTEVMLRADPELSRLFSFARVWGEEQSMSSEGG